MRTTFELKLPVKYYDQDIIIFGNLYQALHDQEKIALLLLSAKIEPSHTEQIFKTTNVPESCLCSDVRQFHRKTSYNVDNNEGFRKCRRFVHTQCLNV